MLEQGIGLVKGYLDIMQDSYGFLRDKTLRNTKNDVYVSQTMIKMFGLSIGDSVLGVTREAEERKISSTYLCCTYKWKNSIKSI